MTKEKFAKMLIETLYDNDDLEIESVNSYQEAGVLTLDTGFVVSLVLARYFTLPLPIDKRD